MRALLALIAEWVWVQLFISGISFQNRWTSTFTWSRHTCRPNTESKCSLGTKIFIWNLWNRKVWWVRICWLRCLSLGFYSFAWIAFAKQAKQRGNSVTTNNTETISSFYWRKHFLPIGTFVPALRGNGFYCPTCSSTPLFPVHSQVTLAVKIWVCEGFISSSQQSPKVSNQGLVLLII